MSSRIPSHPHPTPGQVVQENPEDVGSDDVRRAFIGESPGAADVGPGIPPPVAFAASSPEMIMAQAATKLEESADRSRHVRRQERTLAAKARRAGIAERRRAARWEAAAGVVQASGQIASSASGGETYGQVGDAAGSLIKLGGAEASARGETMQTVADEASARADDLGGAAERAERLASKAMDHAASVSRLSHEARMAALRG